MKRHLFLIILLFIQTFSFCQYRIDWQNCYGTIHEDEIKCIVKTDDGFIFGGLLINSAYTWSTGILIKIDNNGDTIWQKTYDKVLDICRLQNGDYMVMYPDTLLYPDTHWGNVGFRRIDANGNTIWERAYGNEFDMASGSVGGCATSDGGFVGFAPYYQAGGDISHYWGGIADVWVVKIDGNGDMVWETSVGTTGCEGASRIQQTADGGFLMTVTNIVPGVGNMMCKEHQDVNGIPYLVKLDPDGNVQWSFCFGGSYHTSISDAIVLDDGYLIYGFTIADDGDFEGAGYHLGYANGSPNYSRLSDVYLMKIDFDFNIVWCRCYGGRGSEFPTKVFRNDDGGFTVFAATRSIDGDVQSYYLLPYYHPLYYIGLGPDVSWIFRVDANGELLWERVTGGFQDFAENYPRDVVKHNDREYTVASQMTCYEPGWETGDIDCPYNADMPNSGINFWVYHITDIFDYDNVGEVEDTNDAVGLELHPNPASGIVTVRGENIKILEVVNLLGQTVLMDQCHSDNPTIDISILSPGVYLMKAKMADGSVFSDRIVRN